MPKTWRYPAAALGVVLLLYAVIYFALPRQALTPPAGMQPQRPVIDPAYRPARPEITVDESKNPRWIKSLEKSSLAGTEVDRVKLESNEDGELILVPGILVYFDYFLSLQGEMALQRIMQIAYDDMHANFSEPIAAQLYHLFERYIAYGQAMDEILDNLTREEARAQGLTMQGLEEQLRPRFFTDDEIDKLFTGFYDMLDFTPRATSFQKKFQQYQKTPPEYRFAMATELFGAEAAGRLQALERRREQWRNRLESYAREKEQILASEDLDQHGKQQAVTELLERSFDEREQLRVKVWEKHLQDQ